VRSTLPGVYVGQKPEGWKVGHLVNLLAKFDAESSIQILREDSTCGFKQEI
jgi:hypothetical protein